MLTYHKSRDKVKFVWSKSSLAEVPAGQAAKAYETHSQRLDSMPPREVPVAHIEPLRRLQPSPRVPS